MATRESSESRKQARLAIFELANLISVPMSLNAIVRLNVPNAIWNSGANTPLSASQILSRILPSGGGDAENLERMLRMLTSYHVFTEHISSNGEREYSLTNIGQTLATDDDEEGLSYGAYVLQHHQDMVMRAWALVHEAVKDSREEAFVKANGEAAYYYYGKESEMNELMVKAMAGISVPLMKAVLDGYDGFKGVERLVDVGGSGGDCLRMIMQKFPNVKEGINFDLPRVVARAPVIPGVTHVGGDMFKSIPHGDAIFMKWLLTSCNDEQCKRILENCYKALPKGGRVIACEPVLPEESDDSQRTRALLEGDLFLMTVYRANGKHLTQDQFRQLGLSAGFPHFNVLHFDYVFALLEFRK